MQVGRDTRSAGTADQQISAILEIEHFQIWIVLVLFRIVVELLVGGPLIVKTCTFQAKLTTVKDSLIIFDVTLFELWIGIVYQVPCIISNLLDVWSTFFYWMFVEAVIACLADEIDYCLAHSFQMQG